MTPWEVLGWTAVVYLSTIGLGGIVALARTMRPERQQPRMFLPNVVYLDDWRARKEPPKSS